MSRQVSSQVSSSGYTRVQLDQMTLVADGLNQLAGNLLSLQGEWNLTGLQLERNRLTQTCPNADERQALIQGHAAFPFDCATRTCDCQCDDCRTLSAILSDQASALTEAYSLYSSAESFVTLLLRGLLMNPSWPTPAGNLLAAAGISITGYLGLSLFEGHMISMAEFLKKTGSLHQKALSDLSNRIAPLSASPIGRIAEWSCLAAHGPQRRLEVTQVSPTGSGLGSAHSIDQALENLQNLGSRDRGFAYDTVAVQQYRDTDGSTHWVVYIPGTSSHRDSAIGWGQNLQLMSDTASTRAEAASTRLVMEAMRRSGIAPGDRVSLVGHSQGGIVAATLSSDMADQYRFEHVITAGAPIANHPIAPQTWVTSVEMKEELVSSLDARDNTDATNRLTVRGRDEGVAPASVNVPHARQPVEFSAETVESTHGMNYQRAAWQNALNKGVPKANEQDRHFAQSTSGDLVETTYYEGRQPADR